MGTKSKDRCPLSRRTDGIWRARETGEGNVKTEAEIAPRSAYIHQMLEDRYGTDSPSHSLEGTDHAKPLILDF